MNMCVHDCMYSAYISCLCSPGFLKKWKRMVLHDSFAYQNIIVHRRKILGLMHKVNRICSSQLLCGYTLQQDINFSLLGPKVASFVTLFVTFSRLTQRPWKVHWSAFIFPHLKASAYLLLALVLVDYLLVFHGVFKDISLHLSLVL
jgi:hypothetical protein